mmetsp:Transcript_6998/g.10268  ORF Transcript_6998/g.10268 Transcript_6998/m.10268 type:complete len:464 (+) Transcript_6998:1533-2924(+)
MNLNHLKNLIPANYAEQSFHIGLSSMQQKIDRLLKKPEIPQHSGWNDATIKHFLYSVSQLDTNNFPKNAGLGEREGRVWSSIVRDRYFGLTHGIGRSGDIAAMQPKAAGSSLILSLTQSLTLHLLQLAGAKSTKKVCLLPLCTGMSLVLSFQTLRRCRPKSKYIIWTRIDQKTCFKSIIQAGYEPLIVEPELVDNIYVKTGEESKFDEYLNQVGADSILCVLSTSSCFAPRSPDDIRRIGSWCQKNNIPHILNNAYGTQSASIMNAIEETQKNYRLDAYIQSMDKNFEVPVGGAVIASKCVSFIDKIAQTYSGRGSISPILDLFVTLVSQSQVDWKNKWKERKNLEKYALKQLEILANDIGESLISVPHNHVSMAITLNNLTNPTELGGNLFYKSITGPRVVAKNTSKTILDHTFSSYGAHCNNYPHHYMAIAISVGVKREDIDEYCSVLKRQYKKKRKNNKI